MPWYIGSIIGALSLVIGNSIARMYSYSDPKAWVLIAVPEILCIYGFWVQFYNCNSFIVAWFFGSALANTIGIIVGILIFDKGITLSTGVGVSLIWVGAYFLIR